MGHLSSVFLVLNLNIGTTVNTSKNENVTLFSIPKDESMNRGQVL